GSSTGKIFTSARRLKNFSTEVGKTERKRPVVSRLIRTSGGTATTVARGQGSPLARKAWLKSDVIVASGGANTQDSFTSSESATMGCRLYALAVAVEQAHTERMLEVCDRSRYRRLTCIEA